MENKDLIFKTSKVIGKERIYITIAFKSSNKTPYFSITGDIYKAGKPKEDKYHIAGGCIHQDIIKAFPEYEIFIKLHLSDDNGIPMHAVANGLYHLQNNMTKDKFCSYYRLNSNQFEELTKCKNAIEYSIKLKETGVLAQWKKESEIALNLLKELTSK